MIHNQSFQLPIIRASVLVQLCISLYFILFYVTVVQSYKSTFSCSFAIHWRFVYFELIFIQVEKVI